MAFNQRFTSVQILTFCLAILFVSPSFSQGRVINGKVLDSDTSEPLIGAVVQEVINGIEDRNTGVVTDNTGRFTLTASSEFPVKLSISYLGFTKTEIRVQRNNSLDVKVQLLKDLISLDDVLIQGSKYSEEDLRSDLSFDRITIESIQATPSFSYYDAVSNLSEVDVATQGIQNKSINTRGFNIPGNTRFVQIIDGMDNQAPGFNFSLGEFAGLPELDVESVEIFPGTSSFKYGSGATNGALVMKSKSPFEYQGLSAQIKLASNNLGTQPLNCRVTGPIHLSHQRQSRRPPNTVSALANRQFSSGTRRIAARRDSINECGRFRRS